MESTLEKAGALAAEKLKVLKAPEEKAKAEAESKVAAEKIKQVEETKKDEGNKIAQAEAKAKEDERILGAEDKDLKEPEVKRKAELLKLKQEKDNTPDEKIKRIQEATQKRIDEIKSQSLAEQNKQAEKLAKMEAELEELKKPKQQEDNETKIKREQAEVRARFVEEDKSKPKEDRREMSKDELEGWYLEDPVSATEWMQQRTLRRDEEVKKARESLNKPKETSDETKQKLAQEFIDKQNESKAKLKAKYPGAFPSPEKISEARKSLGLPLTGNLNNDEVNKLKDELSKDEHFKLVSEIVSEDPKKYLGEINGPELVIAEMDKRLKKPESKNNKIELTQEELDAKVQAEIERRRLADGESITSTNGGKKVTGKDKKEGSLSTEQQRVALKSKIGAEAYEKMLQRRDNIPGAGSGKDKDD